MQKISLVVFSFFILTNCAWGNEQESKEIEVANFNRVVLIGRAVVHIRQCDKESLTVKGSKNAIDEVTAAAKYGELVIAQAKKGWFGGFFKSNEIPEYTLSIKDLESVTLKGSGEIFSDGPIKGDKLRLIIEGAGQLNFDVDVKEVNVSVFGAGKVILKGTAGNQVVEIEGRGIYEGKDLISSKGKLVINGSGDGEIHAKDELEVTINGSGNVAYLGSPKVNKYISGHGNVFNKKDGA